MPSVSPTPFSAAPLLLLLHLERVFSKASMRARAADVLAAPGETPSRRGIAPTGMSDSQSDGLV
jgi:hypothetical protein